MSEEHMNNCDLREVRLLAVQQFLALPETGWTHKYRNIYSYGRWFFLLNDSNDMAYCIFLNDKKGYGWTTLNSHHFSDWQQVEAKCKRIFAVFEEEYNQKKCRRLLDAISPDAPKQSKPSFWRRLFK